MGWVDEGCFWTCPICSNGKTDQMKKSSLRDRVNSNMSIISKSIRFLSREGLSEKEKAEAVDAAFDALNALDDVPIEVIQYASQSSRDPFEKEKVDMSTDKENAERALRLVRQAARILEGVPATEPDKDLAARKVVEKVMSSAWFDPKAQAAHAHPVVGNPEPVGMFPSMPLVHEPPTLTCAPLIADGTTVVLSVNVRGRMRAPKEVVIENVTGMSARMEHDPLRYGLIGCFAPGTGGSVEFTTDVAHYGPFHVPNEHVASTLLALAALYQNLPRRQ